MRKIVNPKTLKGQDKVNRMLDLMQLIYHLTAYS